MLRINIKAIPLYLIFLGATLLSGTSANAQDRIGIGFTHTVYNAAHFIYRADESSSKIRPVIAMQRWLSDKYFNYYTLDFSQTTLTTNNNQATGIIGTEKVTAINFHFGQGAYFGKKRFEDNTAIFGTYGFALGAGLLKTENWRDNFNGNIEHHTYYTPFADASFIELGLGLEQRISDRYFANVSFNINLGLLSYASLNMRLYYSRYQH